MKRFLISAALVALIAIPVAAAPTVTVGRMTGTFPNPLWQEGEWQLAPNPELGELLGSSAPFQTFCLEVREYVEVGYTYDAVVGDEAHFGGLLRDGEAPGPHGGDLISPQTAYLYTQFRAGTLAGYDFIPGDGRANSADALQAAIWYLEGEAGFRSYDGLSTAARVFVDAADEAYRQGWTSTGDVRVLVLSNGKEPCQDMLAIVPAPGALLLGAIGASLVGWLRRRRQF